MRGTEEATFRIRFNRSWARSGRQQASCDKMRQTLFYIPEYIGNVPVFGFGWLLGVLAIASIVFLVAAARRGNLAADSWGYLPILALGVGLCFFLPRLCHEQGLPIRGYGTFMLLAVVTSTGVAVWRGHRRGVNSEQVLTLVFWGFVPGIIGARVYYVIEYWDDIRRESLADTLVQLVNVADGGLVVYGSFIGASLGFLAFIWLTKMPTLATLDLLAPSIALGAGLGRLGCLMNGCCYGGVCDHDWKVFFPWESPVHVHQVQHGETFCHGLKLPVLPDDEHEGWFSDPIIAEVENGSAAERAGLKKGDEIEYVNGQPISSIRRAQLSLLNAYKLDLLIKTADPEPDYFSWIVEDPFADGGLDQEGQVSIRRVRISDSKNGPVVAEVARGSWAARRDPGVRPGLKPGQKIVSVNGRPEDQPVSSTDEIRRLIIEHRDKPWLTVQIKGRASPAQWLIDIPRSGPEAVHPTQLYSATNGILICLFLLALAPFCRRDGAVWAMLLTLYPITRIMAERIRTDEPAGLGGMTTAEQVSLVVLSCAIALWIFILRKPVQTASSTDGEAVPKR